MTVKPPWRRGKEKHEEVEGTLDRHERELVKMARRVRRLENELGIVAPLPTILKEVNGR